MNEKLNKFLDSSIARFIGRNWLRLCIIGFSWFAIIFVFQRTDLGKNIEYQFAHRLEFNLRDQLGKSPPLDRKIKIFVYDDLSISTLKAAEINLDDWATMLNALGERRPQAIIIDKIFGYISPSDEPSLPRFVHELRNQKSTTVLCSFLLNTLLPQRPLLDLERPEYKLDSEQRENPDALDWLPILNKNAYGPLPEIAKASPFIGQILYHGLGRVYPWIRVSQNRAIPHASLIAAGHLSLDERGTILDGTVLPTDSDGMLPINFTSERQYYKNATSMRSLISRARAKTPITDVQEGDTVLLLPLMYTGNTDLIDTPLGKVPGGFVHASMTNSILTGKWITPTLNPKVMIAAGVITGVAIATIGEPLLFWGAFLLIQTLYILLSMSGFTYLGIRLPWLYPCIAMAATALTIHLIRSVELRKEAGRLKSALSGLLPQKKMKELLAGNSHIVREPCERVVTVMFLDISNFSATAQVRTPSEVFHYLKDVMGRITTLVHKYGGTVDRTLGDGILCFFGYSYDGRIDEKHVDAAIACAIEIQRENVVRCLNQMDTQNPIWPFRIGLNTTSAFIGDLGNQDRMDFTLIGNGVNLAQRLESACNHHSVMISLTTFDLSNQYRMTSAGVNRCKIKVKNQIAMLDCIDFNPLLDMDAQRQLADKAFRERFGLNRSDERWPVKKDGVIEFNSTFGDTHLIDFSRSGCCLGLKELLSRGVDFPVKLTSKDKTVEQKIKEQGLTDFRAVVRWSRPQDKGFIHGIQFVDLNESQQLEFFELMREQYASH